MTKEVKREVIDLLQSHRSIRKYKDKPIEDKILKEILDCAQWASTSHNIQAYSIIVVRDNEKKKQMSKYAFGQKWVENCPVALVFCVDYYRLSLTSEMHNKNLQIEEVENVLMGFVDAALAMENAMVAAQAYGLGGVIVGGIRNNSHEVAEMLKLPKYTMPVAALCLGYPDQDVWQKPRLPQRIVVHEETYNTNVIMDGLKEYDEITSDYYTRRTNGERTDGWTVQMAEYLSNVRRPELKQFMEEKGFKFK